MHLERVYKSASQPALKIATGKLDLGLCKQTARVLKGGEQHELGGVTPQHPNAHTLRMRGIFSETEKQAKPAVKPPAKPAAVKKADTATPSRAVPVHHANAWQMRMRGVDFCQPIEEIDEEKPVTKAETKPDPVDTFAAAMKKVEDGISKLLNNFSKGK